MQGLFPHDAYWELCTLAVDPSTRGRGVGKELVAWGLVKAMEEKLPAGVVCAKGTEDYYRRCGFVGITGVASEQPVDGLQNPLAERSLGGGSVLWTIGNERA